MSTRVIARTRTTPLSVERLRVITSTPIVVPAKVWLPMLSSLVALSLIGIKRRRDYVRRTAVVWEDWASTRKAGSSTSTPAITRPIGTVARKEVTMNLNQNHLFFAFVATLAAVVILALQGDQNLGGTLQII